MAQYYVLIIPHVLRSGYPNTFKVSNTLLALQVTTLLLKQETKKVVTKQQKIYLSEIASKKGTYVQCRYSPRILPCFPCKLLPLCLSVHAVGIGK